jgi:hypothetical protein
MTSADRNDLMPAQEKLEWVTPKISLMDAGDTLGNKMNVTSENWAENFGLCGPLAVNGCGAS